MRFGRPNKRPCDGERRVFHRFLWLPIALIGETRWLEVADIEYRYERSSYDEDRWVGIKFVNP